MNQKDKSSVLYALTLVFQFGINMLVPIFMCTLVGVLIAHFTGADGIVIPLFFVGALAGGRNIYLQAKRLYEKPADDKKDQ